MTITCFALFSVTKRRVPLSGWVRYVEGNRSPVKRAPGCGKARRQISGKPGRAAEFNATSVLAGTTGVIHARRSPNIPHSPRSAVRLKFARQPALSSALPAQARKGAGADRAKRDSPPTDYALSSGFSSTRAQPGRTNVRPAQTGSTIRSAPAGGAAMKLDLAVRYGIGTT